MNRWLMLGVACFSTSTWAVNQTDYFMSDMPAETFSQAFSRGHHEINARARIESDQVKSSPDGQAHTLQTQLRYHTLHWNNLVGLLEFNHVSAFDNHSFNPGLNISPSKNNRPVIADPKGSNLSQAFVSYEGLDKTKIITGRQAITLDNGRFISNNPFRQTPTTFDAVSFTNQSLPDLEIFYAYFWRINTAYAGTNVSQAIQKNKSHAVNVSYLGHPYIDMVGYAYLLDDTTTPSNSANTLGTRLNKILDGENFSLQYGLEYATQKNRSPNPNHYQAHYYAFDAAFKRGYLSPEIQNVGFNMGYEVLSGKQSIANHQFLTPFADSHSFQGSAGMFTTTPQGGIQDAHVGVQATLLDCQVSTAYHSFGTKAVTKHLGDEWDISLHKDFYHYYFTDLEYANFRGNAANNTTNTRKWWFTLGAKFENSAHHR